jgi:3-phenylpropionate/cinnamic acid dioxygenase small subunit
LEINESLARLEIQNVLWRYARGVDRGDYDTIASVYHPDGTDEHVDFEGLGTEFARGLTDRYGHMSTVGQHHITNVIVEMDGDDDARVESYFLSFHPYEAGESVRMGIAAGRYLDHFQRREGEWKILARRVVMDWTRSDFEGPPWPGVDRKPIPGRQKWQDDESYAFFAQAK